MKRREEYNQALISAQSIGLFSPDGIPIDIRDNI